MEIIDLEKLKEDIKALLDGNTYLVSVLQDKKVRIKDKETGKGDEEVRISVIPSQEQRAQGRDAPTYDDIISSQEEIARVRYAPNYHDIIIEEVPPISNTKHIELSSTHRPKLQEMGRKLEEKINREVFPETTPGTHRTVIYVIGSFK